MEPQTTKNRNYKILTVVLVLVLLAGLLGWRLGKSGQNNAQSTPTATSTAPANESASSSAVKSLVSYTLPDGWKEGTCPNAASVVYVYVVPGGSTLDCSANPSAPIKIYVDPQNTTDCQQLNNVQGVQKHVCISLYIDGHKSLKASTEYPQSSAYTQDTTVSDYYIDTGKGVVKVEYTYTSSNNYQTGFDQLATSVKVK